jgi:hypothetical protein
MSCPEGQVSRGDTIAEVHMKCGEPTFWDQRLEEAWLTSRQGARLDRSRTVDEWTYDLGSNRLMRTLTFHDGLLVNIRTGGYGGNAKRTTGDRPALVSVGDTKALVLMRLGDPTYTEQYQKIRTVFVGRHGESLQKTVSVDVFTYDLGPKRLVRILTFENGKLVRKRTGGRGQGQAQE